MFTYRVYRFVCVFAFAKEIRLLTQSSSILRIMSCYMPIKVGSKNFGWIYWVMIYYWNAGMNINCFDKIHVKTYGIANKNNKELSIWQAYNYQERDDSNRTSRSSKTICTWWVFVVLTTNGYTSLHRIATPKRIDRMYLFKSLCA